MHAFHLVGMVLAVPLCAFIHRLRGGGFFKMPVNGRYVLWPFVGLAAWLVGFSPLTSTWWGIGYLIWVLFAWIDEIEGAEGVGTPAGQTIGGGLAVEIPEWIAGGRNVLSVYVRAALFLVPLAILLGDMAWVGSEPLWAPAGLLVIVLAFWPAYLFGWHLVPLDQASVAEPIVGASWGLAMLVVLALGLR